MLWVERVVSPALFGGPPKRTQSGCHPLWERSIAHNVSAAADTAGGSPNATSIHGLNRSTFDAHRVGNRSEEGRIAASAVVHEVQQDVVCGVWAGERGQ